ncbi:hypothetical protein [Nocardioides acrostichi]|uniref:Uncharacterized protein n=1 Tax=Nocardioides acrostichi TaxID=2784339 RepID=A0A930Y7R3_9ACTN|nr:hypothetical protein [Nocardioides acrostichi]MBF4162307.1 hypothetical protein [Nocardioides acrostichi]
MHAQACAPVTWPAPSAIDRWRREALAVLDESYVGAGGVLVLPEGSTHERHDDTTIRLEHGRHLQPGARYVVESGDLRRSGLELDARIDGTHERRTGRIAVTGFDRVGLPVVGTRPSMDVEIDGLDDVVHLVGTSTHPYLTGTARLVNDAARLLRIEARLRWLSVDLHAWVADGELVADLTVRSRGAWAPAVAPILAIISRWAPKGLTSAVEDWAEQISAVAEGREPHAVTRARKRERERLEDVWCAAQLRRRAEAVQAEIEQASWWGQRRRAWLAAWERQPDVAWPDGDREREEWQQSWAQRAESLATSVSRVGRKRRRAEIESWLGAWTPREPQPAPVDDSPMPPDLLQLAWLKSPRTVLSMMRGSGSSTPSGDVGALTVDE